jgi:hypothetical protein
MPNRLSMFTLFCPCLKKCFLVDNGTKKIGDPIMINWGNLGKKRTKFGKWLDKQGIHQDEIKKEIGGKVGGTTISKMANKEDYSPKYSTWQIVKKALLKRGHNKDYNDFWT